ncbi:hypothetical protein COOONC_14299, partial [Cooperia oncophora]
LLCVIQSVASECRASGIRFEDVSDLPPEIQKRLKKRVPGKQLGPGDKVATYYVTDADNTNGRWNVRIDRDSDEESVYFTVKMQGEKMRFSNSSESDFLSGYQGCQESILDLPKNSSLQVISDSEE